MLGLAIFPFPSSFAANASNAGVGPFHFNASTDVKSGENANGVSWPCTS